MLAWFITFNFVNFAWVFFRAKDFNSAIKVIKGMFGFDLTWIISTIQSSLDIYSILIFMIILFTFTLYCKNSVQVIHQVIKRNLFLWTVYFSILFIIGVFFIAKGTYTEFIYFNF